MGKKIGIIIMTLACLLVLAACGCEHVWQDATCLAPATCSECGKTEGEIGEHIWQEATCDTPKTCSTCGATEGGKLEHKWLTTKCTSTCERCGAEDPTAPGHQWQEADCNNPRYCYECGFEDGEPLGHDWVEASCDTAKSCKACNIYEGEALGHTLGENSDGVAGICTVCNKAVEYYFSGASGDTMYAWTTYDVAEDGSYTNPVTYLIADWKDDHGLRRYQTIRWFEDGKLKHYQASQVRNADERPKAFYEAYYAEGKVYYFTAYSANNANAVLRALMNAAAKYISFAEGSTNGTKPTNVVLSGSGGWLADTKGYVDAAYDAHGNPFAIVHNLETGETWAVACDWQK